MAMRSADAAAGVGKAVDVVVLDSENKPVLGLGQSDFTILEDDVKQQTTHFVLHPGECVRTPRILLVGWSGNRFDGHNALRRIIYRYHTPLLAGQRPLPPTQCNTWFPVGDDGGKFADGDHAFCLQHLLVSTTQFARLFFDAFLQNLEEWVEAGVAPPPGAVIVVQNGQPVLDAFVHLPLVLPPVVTGYLLLLTFGRRGLIGAWLADHLGIVFAFRWTGAALACGVMSFPLLVRPMRLSIEAIDRKLEQAAETLGAAPWKVFFTVTLPLALPGVIAGMMLSFARALGEFGATIMVAGNIPGRTTVSLNGAWHVIIDPYETGLGEHYYENAKPKDKRERKIDDAKGHT